MDDFKFTDYLAIYASIIATLPFIIQALSYLNNRASIKLSSKMLIECRSGPSVDGKGCLVSLKINILNNGERIAYIEEVGVQYFGKGLFKKLNPKNKGTKFVLFSEKVPKSLTEKQKETFEIRSAQLSYIAERMSKKETAYVILSSGKTVKVKFTTTSLSKEGFSLDNLQKYQ